MTIDKDKLLILGVVAVLGFFLWKSRKDSEAKKASEAAGMGYDGISSAPNVDKNRVYSIVSALGLEQDDKQSVLEGANWTVSCKQNYSSFDTSKEGLERKAWIDEVSASAKSNRITFEQQAVIEGLWMTFMSENCILKDQDTFERCRSMVLAM